MDIPTVKLAEFCRSIGASYMRLSWQSLRNPQRQWTCGIESTDPRIEVKEWGFTPQKAFAKAVFAFLSKMENTDESTEATS